MGPQSLDCGRLGTAPRFAGDGPRFNGAAVTRLRKAVPGIVIDDAGHASMGPQSLDCGRYG